MKFNFTDKNIGILKVVSQISGVFVLVIAITMIFSFIQLKLVNPLDNPALATVKDQYDNNPADAAKAEQVRAMDLIARKAYFSSRWQVETGSYLLLAGVIVFIFCQKIITDYEKKLPVVNSLKPDTSLRKEKSRKYLLTTSVIIIVSSVAVSFFLRADLPDLSGKKPHEAGFKKEKKGNKNGPDKTNWPFFRGQDSRAIAGGSGYPVEWNGSGGKNIVWKKEIPKKGKSSPVIWGDKIFLTGAQDKSCEVYCLNKKTGDIIWTGSASGIQGEPSDIPKTDAEAGMAVSTVATNGTVVCAVFANGNLVCFDMDGKQKWSRNIGVPETSYGYSSSLLIYENLLLVKFDSNKKISLIGFDLNTGDQKWETPRKGHPAWSSPVIAYFGGKPEVIINGNPFVSGFDPVTGSDLWDIECMSGDVAPSVAANSTMTYAVTDYAKLVAIKPGNTPTVAWEDNSFTPDVSSPVANDDFLFISTGSGDVACYNAMKGDTAWTHVFQDPFYASPVIADNKVYFLDRNGMMHIVKASSPFSLIGESSVGEPTDCTPAFSDDRIYIRGKNNLYCIAKN